MDNNLKTFVKNVITNSEDSLNFILDTDSIIEITEELLEEGIEFVEFDYDEFLDIADENDILSLAKNTYEDGTQEYFVDGVFGNNGVTLMDESDYVYIDSDLLDCVDISKFSGTVIEISDEEEDDCECCHCSECEDEEGDLSDECLGDCQSCDGCEEDKDLESMTEEEILNYISETTAKAGMKIGEALKLPFRRMVEQDMEERLEEFEETLNEHSDDEDFCVHCAMKEMLTNIYLEAHHEGYEFGKKSAIEDLEILLGGLKVEDEKDELLRKMHTGKEKLRKIKEQAKDIK